MWLTALTSANERISEFSETLIDDQIILDALISVENKFRVALNCGSNSVNAFGEAVKAAETFAMQTVDTSGFRSVNSTNCKVIAWLYVICIQYIYIDGIEF